MEKELITLGMLGAFHDIPTSEDTITFKNVLELLRGIPNPKILEVGTYTGVTIINIAKLFPNAFCFAVDNFSLEETELQSCRDLYGENFSLQDVKSAFLSNTEGENITLIENDSTIALRDFIDKEEIFDFIYVDGSHTSLDTVIDLVLAWLLLPINGILAIDDYQYTPPGNSGDTPRQAVDCFLRKFDGEYTVLSKGYRMFLQKKF